MEEQTSFDSIFESVTEADVADMTESENTNEQEVEAIDAEPKEEKKEDVPQEQKYKLKYLGEEKEVSIDEMTALSQKGMDYDRIKGKYNEIHTRLKELAGDVPIDEFLTSLGAKAQENALSKRVDELLETGDYSEAGARKQAELEMRLKGQDKLVKAQSEIQRRGRSIGEFAMNNEEFRKTFPDGRLAQEIINDINSGKSISEAWVNYQLAKERNSKAELEQRIAQLEQNLKNKESAAPSVSTKNTTETDPFLQGLFGR